MKPVRVAISALSGSHTSRAVSSSPTLGAVNPVEAANAATDSLAMQVALSQTDLQFHYNSIR